MQGCQWCEFKRIKPFFANKRNWEKRLGAPIYFLKYSSSHSFTKTDFGQYLFKVVRITGEFKHFDTCAYEAKSTMPEGFETSKMGSSLPKDCAIAFMMRVLLNARPGLILAANTIVLASKVIRSVPRRNAPTDVWWWCAVER